MTTGYESKELVDFVLMFSLTTDFRVIMWEFVDLEWINVLQYEIRPFLQFSREQSDIMILVMMC